MNIKELKEKIKDLPDNMDVIIQKEDTIQDYIDAKDAEVISLVRQRNGWQTIDSLLIKD